jgi:hypothetical protein
MLSSFAYVASLSPASRSNSRCTWYNDAKTNQHTRNTLQCCLVRRWPQLTASWPWSTFTCAQGHSASHGSMVGVVAPTGSAGSVPGQSNSWRREPDVFRIFAMKWTCYAFFCLKQERKGQNTHKNCTSCHFAVSSVFMLNFCKIHIFCQEADKDTNMKYIETNYFLQSVKCLTTDYDRSSIPDRGKRFLL